jgi:hypothetical protein
MGLTSSAEHINPDRGSRRPLLARRDIHVSTQEIRYPREADFVCASTGLNYLKIRSRDRFEFCHPPPSFGWGCIRAFAQLTGDESLVAKCSEIRGNIGDFSKDTSKDDICQFESSHPSHAFRGGVLHIRAKIAFRTEASPACNPQDSSTWDSRLSSSSSFREEARAARPDPLRRAA